MKTVLISIKGRWWKKILSGEKGLKFARPPRKILNTRSKLFVINPGKELSAISFVGVSRKRIFIVIWQKEAV